MKKVVVALPGREYSGSFLTNWSQSLIELTKRGYQVTLLNEFNDLLRYEKNIRINGQPYVVLQLTIKWNLCGTPKNIEAEGLHPRE